MDIAPSYESSSFTTFNLADTIDDAKENVDTTTLPVIEPNTEEPELTFEFKPTRITPSYEPPRRFTPMDQKNNPVSTEEPKEVSEVEVIKDLLKNEKDPRK